MSKTFVKTDRQTLGWFAAVALFLSLASPAWGLDLDTQRLEADNAQILSTLGHGRVAGEMTSRATRKTVQMHLLKKHHSKRTVRR